MLSSSLTRKLITGENQEADIPGIKESIIRTLVYFDIFHYPLTAAETRLFLQRKSDEVDIHEALTQLLKEKRIFLHQDFFSIQDNSLLSARRKEGNARAEKLMVQANKIGRFLNRFPFVKGVAISGSLSKNFADEKADIDFFIITTANRLWIARTFLHLYKKLTFLTGRQHLYCMNYFLDEDALFLEEQNIFSAVEIKTLIPVSGDAVMQNFFLANSWTDEWLPAFTHKKAEKKNTGSGIKSILEWILKGRMGNKLENSLLKITQKRWQEKEAKGKQNIKGQTMGFISGKHFAMSNPGNFREKVLQTYNSKLEEHKPASLHPRPFKISIVR